MLWRPLPWVRCLRIDVRFSRPWEPRRSACRRGMRSPQLRSLERKFRVSEFNSTPCGRLAPTDLAGDARADWARSATRKWSSPATTIIPAPEFRDLLEANGLTAPSGHIAIDLIETKPDKTFADAHTVGHEWITVPSLPRGKHETADDWKRVAAQFNAAAAKAKAAGFRFAFHNHNDIVKNDERRAADRDPDAGDGSGARVVPDGHLLGGERRRRSAGAARAVSRPVQDVSREGRQAAVQPTLADRRRPGHDRLQADLRARRRASSTTSSSRTTAADPMAFAAASYKYLANLEF